MPSEAPTIEDYALIGDARSCALVSRDGSIDWLCLPHFSSPSLFGALLDPERGGRFSVTPDAEHKAVRRYVGESAVIETDFRTATGAVRMTDAMIIGQCAGNLAPLREIVRIVEGLEGKMPLRIVFEPRPDYAGIAPTLERRRGGLVCRWGSELLVLRCDRELSASGDGAQARLEIAAGDRLCFSLSYDWRDIAVLPPLGTCAADRTEETRRRWQDWSASLAYDGRYMQAVRRSAVTLKLMTFAPSGAVVAAPTTSLPEWIGAGRNWDYRFCWLRDAALTMRAFTSLGLEGEAAAFLRWLLHATALTQPRLGVVYDIFGRTKLKERVLDRLSGYRDSRPVRIGNDAYRQVQLDVYGGVIAAAEEYASAGGRLQADQRRLLAGFGSLVCRLWRDPDHGLWEIRGEKRHYTFSKLMCWVALDRLMKLDEDIGLDLDRRRIAAERTAIEQAIDSDGYDAQAGAYAATLGGDGLDASLLLMPCLGFKDPADPRLHKTVKAIEARLGEGPLVYRYAQGSDALGPNEGAFGICSFWLAEALARIGEVEQAKRNFEKLLQYGNDVGLYAEEIDPDSGTALGNFPQAFTHVGLINAAVAIDRAEKAARTS